MSNLNLQKLREWVWWWPWTFKVSVKELVKHEISTVSSLSKTSFWWLIEMAALWNGGLTS